MKLIATLLIGFSVVASAVLFVTYVFCLHNVNRSWRAFITGFFLLTGLSALQLGHLAFIDSGANPLDSLSYRFWLFMCPSMFYLFSRSILFDEAHFGWQAAPHLASFLLIFIPQIEVSTSILFCIGTGYSLWLTQVVYGIRADRGRSGFELFFLVLFTLMAIGVLVLGFALPYINAGYFYYFYTFGIGLALVLVVGVLLGFPELLADLAEAAKRSYVASTLNGVDRARTVEQLDVLMTKDKVYQQDDLSLASLAEMVSLSTHQLSELINTEHHMSFSRFIRTHRVKAAERLLVDEPQSTILAIGMEVGFKSQSNFYAAFKDITGLSPGTYRESIK